MFEKCGRTTDDDGRRTPDAGYTISSPCEPEGSGELIIKKNITTLNNHIPHSAQFHNI